MERQKQPGMLISDSDHLPWQNYTFSYSCHDVHYGTTQYCYRGKRLLVMIVVVLLFLIHERQR